jgi:hypothetical protein
MLIKKADGIRPYVINFQSSIFISYGGTPSTPLLQLVWDDFPIIQSDDFISELQDVLVVFDH